MNTGGFRPPGPLSNERLNNLENDISKSKKPMKKRKYSRGGCQECKRRKMKCDEGKPFCYNCTKLSKQCVYELKKYRFENVNGSMPSHPGFDRLFVSFSDQNKKGSNHFKTPHAMQMRFYEPPEHTERRTEWYPNDLNVNYRKLNTSASPTESTFDFKPQNIHGLGDPKPQFNKQYGDQMSYLMPDQRNVTSPTTSYANSIHHINQNLRPNHPDPSATQNNMDPAVTIHLDPVNNDVQQNNGNTNADSNVNMNLNLSLNQGLQQGFTPTLNQDVTHNISPIPNAKSNVNEIPGTLNALVGPSSESVGPEELPGNYLDNDLKEIFDEALTLVNDLNVFFESESSFSGSEINRDSVSYAPPAASGFRENPDKTTNPSLSGAFAVDEFQESLVANSNVGFEEEKLEDIDTPHSVLINEIASRYRLTPTHYSYLIALVSTRCSFHIFPFASSINTNEVINLLLRYLQACSFLLTALLTLSATFQYNLTLQKIHKEARKSYLSLSVKLLGEAFPPNGKIRSSHMSQMIERLLLTDLLLASNFTAVYAADRKNMDTWNTHIGHARQLLVTYLSWSSSLNTNHSCGLALAKTWFYAIDSLARLNMISLKGQIDSNFHLESVMELNKVRNEILRKTGYSSKEANPKFNYALRRLRLIIVGSVEFNLFLGYTMNVVLLEEQLVEVMDALSTDPHSQFTSDQLASLLNLVHKGKDTSIIPQVCKKTFIIPESSPAYPENQNSTIKLPPSAFGRFVDEHYNVQYYSWYDLSEQIHLDVLYIKILTDRDLLNLPIGHPLVQNMKERLMKYLIFVRPKDSPIFEKAKPNILAESENYYITHEEFDIRCTMIQSIFRICFHLVSDEASFEPLELFFQGLVKLGNGSSTNALKSLQLKKERIRQEPFDSDRHISYEDNEVDSLLFC